MFHRHSKRFQRVCRWLVTATLVGSVQGVVAGEGPAGMTMDVKGKVEQTPSGGSAAPLKLLDYVPPGTTVELADQASMSLTVYADKKLYQFTGPARFEVTPDGMVKLVSGSEPAVKPLGERRLASSQQGSFIPGSTRMRSAMAPVVLMSPAKGSILTEAHPGFAWASAQQGPFVFRLIGPDGATVWETTVKGRELQLPADIKLQSGVQYKWQVGLEKGHGKSDRGQFSVADAAQLKAVRDAAPPASASVEELVLYAVDLRDAGYVEEAKKVVQQISKTRPDLAEAILSAD